MDQHQIVAGLREERERVAEYLRALPAESWAKDSLCEGWSVRDVVSHLVGNCADVLDQNMDGIGSPASNQRQVDERASKTTNDLLDEWAEKAPGCEAIYEAFPPEMWSFEMGGVLGTIGKGVLRHLEDLWVHFQDIRLALGDGPSEGPGLAAALDLIVEELPKQLKIASPDASALELDLDGEKQTIPLEGSGDPIRVSGNPLAFALLATGRVTLDFEEEAGRLTVDPRPDDGRLLCIYGAAFEERL